MKRGSKVSGIIVAITALAAAPHLAETGGRITTADLAMQLARAAGISLPANESPQAALESLGRAGIKLGSDLKAPVTEKVLAQVALALGVRASTSRPEEPASAAQCSAFISLFKRDLQRAAAVSGESGTDNVHASCQGRDSRASRQGTPASPSDFDASAGPCEVPGP